MTRHFSQARISSKRECYPPVDSCLWVLASMEPGTKWMGKRPLMSGEELFLLVESDKLV